MINQHISCPSSRLFLLSEYRLERRWYLCFRTSASKSDSQLDTSCKPVAYAITNDSCHCQPEQGQEALQDVFPPFLNIFILSSFLLYTAQVCQIVFGDRDLRWQLGGVR